MADKIDMSLDDIIKSNKKPAFKKQGGNVRNGNNNKPANGNRNGSGPVRNNANRQNRRQSGPYTRPAPQNRNDRSQQGGRWPHDKFESNVPKGVGKLMISNLHYRVSNQDLIDLFSEFGKVNSANVFYDKQGNSLGNAQVIFSNFLNAQKAKKQYNGILLDGRKMIISLEGEVLVPAVNRLQKPPQKSNNNQNQQNRRNNNNNSQNNKNRGGNAKAKPAPAPRSKKAAPTQEELDAALDQYINKQA